MAEEGQTVPGQRWSEVGAGGAEPEATAAGRTGRLRRRLEALERGHRRPEPISVLKLLTTEEIRRALALVERSGVLPNGEVRCPEVFREATPGEWEALEHWRKLYGEPLDHLELAEELLDRMGEAHGWHSREALHAALLFKRLELPGASSWLVGKMAEAVLSLYAELEAHPNEPRHARVRGAVRRLARLEEIDRLAPRTESTPQGNDAAEKPEVASEQPAPPSQEPPGDRSEAAGPRETAPGTKKGPEDLSGHPFPQEEEKPRAWWRRVLGG